MIRAAIKLFLLLLVSALISLTQPILMLFTRGPITYTLPQIWHRTMIKIFGLKVEVTGEPHTESQCLFVSNHLSYLDIPVIGSVLRASFVAKEEVRSWPLFGFLGTLQQTAYISRSRHHAATGKNALETMLKEGKSLILFPEGTSSDGSTVLPFKSSLFSIATNENTPANLVIQPMTITVLHMDSNKKTTNIIGSDNGYSWYGDMTLTPHLWALAKSKGGHIRLTFHPPCKAADYLCRKDLAKKCQNDVAKGIGALAQAA